MPISPIPHLLQQAIALHRIGDIGGAAALYQQIIRQDSGHADAHQLLGVIARQMGKPELARQLLERAVALQPRHAPALANLALLLRESGENDAALTRARDAVAADPAYAEGHIALGGLLAAARDHAGALRHYRLALARQPENAALLNDIANAERHAGNFAAAHEAVAQALALQPALAMLHHTRGNILRASGYPDLALTAFAEAARLDPAQAESRQNAALCHLLLGDFAAGWALYAQRGQAEPRYAALQPWDGEQTGGLLVHAEQGLGDTLQFVRLVHAARAVAGRVVLEVQKPLLRLLRHSLSAVIPAQAGIRRRTNMRLEIDIFKKLDSGSAAESASAFGLGRNDEEENIVIPNNSHNKQENGMPAFAGMTPYFCDSFFKREPVTPAKAGVPVVTEIKKNDYNATITVITPDDPLPAGLTHRCRMLDLPQWFDVDAKPYLRAPEMPDIAARLASIKTPRIGLVWAGNPGHLNDANRSLALALLEPVLRPWTAHVVSLQKGPRQAELTGAGFADGGAWCADFADTGHLVQELDLIISVDTSVAHLAGGMGKPVWLLLPYDPDWRWMLQRRDTPWYPRMKLYRQAQPGDWSAPLEELRRDLAALMAGDLGVLPPPVWKSAAAQRPERSISLS